MSAVGSLAISGASRWLDAFAFFGALVVATAAPIATAAHAKPASATALFLMRPSLGVRSRRRGPGKLGALAPRRVTPDDPSCDPRSAPARDRFDRMARASGR